MTRLALALAALLPLAAAAEPPAPAAPEAAPPAAQEKALRLAAPRAGGLTVAVGGALSFTGFTTVGALDHNDLPTAAVPPSNEQTLGATARQSRVDLTLGLPADGLLGAAGLEGFAELDFAGDYQGGDQSRPMVRFRQGWVSARWREHWNLTLLVGQAWGLTGTPEPAKSLGHLSIPRFTGAGVLWRLAPQVRVSAETGGPWSVVAQAALLAPIDPAKSPAATDAAPDRPPPTSVGERSGLPDVEGRLALRWRPAEGRRLEVGLSGHAGREKWRLSPGGVEYDATVDSYAGVVDLALDWAWLSVRAGGYLGKNLDVLNTLTAGVTLSLDAAGRPVQATGVETSGGFAQVQVRALPWLTLILGGGVEQANRLDLPPNPASATVPLQNLQASGGAIVDLTSRWQAGLEWTTYQTTYVDLVDRTLTSGQCQLSTRYRF